MPTIADKGESKMKGYFIRLNEYNIWANNNTLESIRNTAVLDTRASELFSHILIAQTIWLDRISQHPISFDSPWIKLSAEESEHLSQKSYNDWKIYLTNIGEAELSKFVEYKNVKGDTFKNKLSDIIAHVFNHSSYHRGQIAQHVKKSNGQPAVTDFIVFARL
jgi:uncharacterized damage-inducible protein DinB